jgi:cobalt-zinc-cadmium efflux system protein
MTLNDSEHNPNHDHDHHHHSHGNLKGEKLKLVIFLNILITVSQVIGGLFSGSLSLLSDALHNASDVFALLISYIAEKLVRKKATLKQTFGLKRAEIVAAAINAIILIGIGLNLIGSALTRLGKSHGEYSINPNIVMGLALFGIVINGLSVLILEQDARNSLNIRSAYLHLLTDTLTSVAVLFTGVIIYFFKINLVDSIVSISIALYLIYSSWILFKQALDILMQFAPAELNLLMVEKEIILNPEVINLHHVHVWQLHDHQVHFEAHITLKNNLSLVEVGLILSEIEHKLKEKFNIHHVILQPEYQPICEQSLIRN